MYSADLLAGSSSWTSKLMNLRNTMVSGSLFYWPARFMDVSWLLFVGKNMFVKIKGNMSVFLNNFLTIIKR